MLNKIKRRAGLAVAATAMMLGSMGANAFTVYSETFQGVTFTLSATDGASSFTLRIQNAFSTTNANWVDATYLGALGFKDLGIDFQAAGVSASMTSSPAGSWTYVQSELDADGCKDPSGQKGVICFSKAPPLAITDDMLFTITILGATLDIASSEFGTPHVKLQFLDAAGVKEGSLYSHNLPGTDTDSDTDTDTDTDTPEPGTLALLGLGLIGLGAIRRRKA